MTNAKPTNGDLWFLNSRVSVRLAKADNADGISILDHWNTFDDAPPLHIHHGEDEIFHVLSGEIRFEVGGRTVIGRAGDVICAPKGVPHGYRVVSPEGARYMTVTLGGFEAMVRSASRPAAADGLPPMVEPDAAMQRMLAELCAAQQIELIGPPIT